METETGNGVGTAIVERKARGKLTPEYKALLGTMPDGDLAKLAGVTYPAVYMARSKLGIVQFGKGTAGAAPVAKAKAVKAKGPKAAPAVKMKRKGAKAKVIAATPIVLPAPVAATPVVSTAPSHEVWAAEMLLKLAGSKEYAIKLIKKLPDSE